MCKLCRLKQRLVQAHEAEQPNDPQHVSVLDTEPGAVHKMRVLANQALAVALVDLSTAFHSRPAVRPPKGLFTIRAHQRVLVASVTIRILTTGALVFRFRQSESFN